MRRLTLVLMMWLAYDFGRPDVPGAFVFDADQCLDGVETRVLVPEDHVTGPMPAPDWAHVRFFNLVPVSVPLTRHEPPPLLAPRLPCPRSVGTPPRDTPRSSEEH